MAAQTKPERVTPITSATPREAAKPDILASILEATTAKADIESMLGKDQTFDQITAAVRMAVRDNPEILKCTERSIRQAVTRAVQMGLEIGVTVHLVPFNVNVAPKGQSPKWEKRLSAIASYQGLIQLMIASHAIRHVEAPRVVYEGELFEEKLGSEKSLVHAPDFSKHKPGKIVAAYVFYRLPFGIRDWVTMSIGEIEAIRAKSKQWSKGECPAWYAQKSVVRRMAKYVPTDRRLAKFLTAAALDAEEEGTPIVDHIVAEQDGMRQSIRASMTSEGEAFDPETGEVHDAAPDEEYQNDTMDLGLDDESPSRDAVREGR